MMRSPTFTAALLAALLLGACAGHSKPPPAAPVPDPAHSSAHALDWAGPYAGTLPCADCEGIATLLQLNADNSYLRQTRYLDQGDAHKTFEQRGVFSWDAAGATIQLQGVSDAPNRYRVAEGRLIQLDLSGQPITGALADRYVLSKAAGLAAVSAAAKAQLIAGGHVWRLAEIQGKPVPPGSGQAGAPTLVFKTDGSGAYGFSGCNNFQAAVKTLDQGQLGLGPLASTLRACADTRLEQRFLQLMQRARTYQAEGRQLRLYGADTPALLRFELQR